MPDSTIIIIIFAFAILFLSLAGWFLLSRLRGEGELERSLDLKLFLVTLPKEQQAKTSEEHGEKKDSELVAPAEQFYSLLGGLKSGGWWNDFIYGPPCVVFELVAFGQDIRFYVAAPHGIASSLEKHIHGIWPEAEIEPTRDYNIFQPQGSIYASFLKLKKNPLLPLRTYRTLERDPLSGVTNAFSKISEGEGAVLQLVLRPDRGDWGKLGNKVAKAMSRDGKDFAAALRASSFNFLDVVISGIDGLLSVFSPSPTEEEKAKKKERSERESRLTPAQEEILKQVEGKAGKRLFETNVRLISSARTPDRAKQILDHLESAFSQYDAPNLNGFRAVHRFGKIQKLIFQFSFRLFDRSQTDILSTEELAGIYHFPLSITETPGLKWLKARFSPPPVNLPERGIILGRNIYRGAEKIVRMVPPDRARHFYIIGQTGTGKSTLMQEMIRQDMAAGEGVGIIDPHGDVAKYVLSHVPQERAQDVIYFDPADTERPMGLNMLEYNPAFPEQKTFIINELIEIFNKLYNMNEVGGPMFEQYFRNAAMLVMDDPASGNTLLEIQRLFTDSAFRDYKLSRTKNPVVINFWRGIAEKANRDAALSEMAPYIVSKFDTFLSNEIMRPIVAQEKSAFNFREIMDARKILIVNLSKGRLGELNSSLLGLIIVEKLLMASLSRTDVPEAERTDFYLYIDEFQNFTTASIATILSEARKYKLNLTIAHQFIKQLQENIRDAVFGNVGSMAAFRIGAEDAETVAKQFAPVFNENDLINIDNYNFYLRLLISGQTTRSFNVQTYPGSAGNKESAEKIKQLSRLKYGRLREEIEKEIGKKFETM